MDCLPNDPWLTYTWEGRLLSFKKLCSTIHGVSWSIWDRYGSIQIIGPFLSTRPATDTRAVERTENRPRNLQ